MCRVSARGSLLVPSQRARQAGRSCSGWGVRTSMPSGCTLAPSGVMYTPSGEMLMAVGATTAPAGKLPMMQGAYEKPTADTSMPGSKDCE